MINNDETYQKQLQSQSWFNYSKYVDIEKIQAHIPSFQYLIEQFTALETFCTDKVFEHVMSKQNLFDSQNARNLERNGVPPKYMRQFLLKLFNITNINESNYESFQEITLKKYQMKDIDEFVPYFTGKATLKESLPVHFLNDVGIDVLKEILWMLNGLISTIEFSPLIIQITSMLLVFCNRFETFEIMSVLLDANYNLKETYKIRWHLRFTCDDNVKIISSIVEALKDISHKSGKESFEHFTKINFPPEKLYEDICFSFFTQYFNFYGMVRLLPFFLVEGIKSFYRLSYAIVKTLKTEITNITSPDDVIKQMRVHMKSFTNISQLFELSYNFGLTRYNNKYDIQNPESYHHKNRGNRNSYYLPHVEPQSNILTDVEIIETWKNLPFDIKIKDAKKVFDTSVDGYALNTILGLNKKYAFECVTMFVLETLTGEKFGGIISNLLRHTDGKFIRPMTSVLLEFKQGVKMYFPNKDREDIVYVDTTCIMFGNGTNGPAIRIDKDLNGGFSYGGGAFGNEKLVGSENGEFKVKKMEVFILE